MVSPEQAEINVAEALDLTEMPEDKFLELFRGVSQGVQPAQDDLPASVTGETRNALNQLTDALNIRVGDTISEQGQKMGIRSGTFLDISTGAPASVRFQLGLDENQINQFKYLNRVYGPGNVDLSTDGRFIVRNQPTASGGVEDVMVDPIGFEGGDIAQLGSQLIPMAAGAAAALLSRGKSTGWKAVLKASGLAALFGETAGALQDAAVRKLRDDTVNASEIAKQRSVMALADTAFGLAAAGGAKVGTKIVEGIIGLPGVVGEMSTEGMKQAGLTPTKTRLAREKLSENTGVEFSLTPGQEAESPLLLRGENIIRSRPGSASVMDAIEEAQSKQEEELRRVFLGLDRKLTDEELSAALPKSDVTGQRALQSLRPEAARVRGEVETSLGDIRQTASREAQMIGDVDLDNPLSSTEVGKMLRTRTLGDMEQFRSEMRPRYEAFLSKPEVKNRIVSGNALARDAAAIEKRFIPAAEKNVEQKAYDAYGSPTTKSTKETVPLDKFIPAKVRSFLDQLTALHGAKIAVRDLKQIRTGIDDAIAEGIAIPGTDTAALKAIRESVDENITTALKDIDPTILSEWETLSSDYSKGISRFDKRPIREMLIKEGERGSLGDTVLAERIMGNTAEALDNFNAYKEFFGNISPEFQDVMRRARERTLETAKDELTPYISGSSLRNKLRNLRSEVAEELFGANETELHRIGDILDKTSGTLDLDELSQLANRKGFTASRIQGLIDAETERVKVYGNKLIKAAANGTLDAEKIKPSDFVRTLRSMDPDDAQRVLGVLADKPELVKDIKQLAVEDIWERIQSGPPGHERVSGVRIREAIGNETQRRTLESVVGKDVVDNLVTWSEMLNSRDFSAGAFGGSLGAQQDMQKLMLSPKGAPGEIKSLAVRYLMGVLYSGPLKRSVVNLMTSQDRGRFLNSVIASTPFIDGLRERFGPDGALALMQTYRSMVEPMQQKEMSIQGQIKEQQVDPSTLSPEEFKAWFKNNTAQ